jgi:DNA-binding NtrC family response regulator
MPNTSKILIVDDDAELRDALTEQLSLHEEFEAVVAENGSRFDIGWLMKTLGRCCHAMLFAFVG